MSANNDAKKRQHEAAFREGQEEARHTGAAEGFVDSMASLILPDSLGTTEYESRRAGYKEAAGETKFAAGPSRPPAPITLDASEKAWFALCDASDFIPEQVVAYYQKELRAQGHQAVFVAGLSNFIGHACPRCGATGQFKVHFLGHLRHSECGWEGYSPTGSYIGFQFAQIIVIGIRAGGSMKDGADKKGDRHSWFDGVLGFFFGSVFRAMTAVVLIPLHCVAALFQADQTKADVASRVITLAIIAIAIGVGAYEILTFSPRAISSGVDYPTSQPPVVQGQQAVSGEVSVAPVVPQLPNRDSVIAATGLLIGAIERHDLVAASSALDQGADPNMTCSDAHGVMAACGDTETPLHLAVVPDRLVGPAEPGQFATGVDMILLLLEHGADPNRRGSLNFYGPSTVLRHVVLWTDTNYGVGYPSPTIISLMLAHGANPALDNPMQDALDCANKNGQYPEVAATCLKLVELLKTQSQ